MGTRIIAQVPDWGQKQFDENANFYEIQEEVNNFYNNNQNFKTGNEFHFKDFQRWERFWVDRVSGGNVKDGSFKYANNAISSLPGGEPGGTNRL